MHAAQAFKRAVGRSYRVIDRLDVVAALPPFQGYIQLDFPLWIQVSPCPCQCCADVTRQARLAGHAWLLPAADRPGIATRAWCALA